MAEIGVSDKMQALFTRGNAHEIECLEALEATGWDIIVPDLVSFPTLEVDEAQWYVKLEVAGAKVTGHLDGIGGSAFDTGVRVIEIKSPISWAKWERAHKTGDYSDPLMNRYAWQISVYMVATGLEAVVACVEDGRVRTFGIEVAPHSLQEIHNRVESMELAVDSGDDVTRMACSQSDYPCPVAYLHDRAEVVEDPKLDAMLLDYADLKVIKDRVDKDMKELRDEVDAHLGIDDTRTTAAGTVTRVSTTRTTYDTKAAIADGVDLAKYAKTSSSTSIRVTPKVDGDPSSA
jgi:hypothetical protein